MKILLEMNGCEERTNIGIANALIDFLDDSDICEISQYLMVYSNARTNEKLTVSVGCSLREGGEGDGKVY